MDEYFGRVYKSVSAACVCVQEHFSSVYETFSVWSVKRFVCIHERNIFRRVYEHILLVCVNFLSAVSDNSVL